tara:strand:- start:314 stop:511 length:198 start_codon:yes stop_codon:yes gene_type:complete
LFLKSNAGFILIYLTVFLPDEISDLFQPSAVFVFLTPTITSTMLSYLRDMQLSNHLTASQLPKSL